MATRRSYRSLSVFQTVQEIHEDYIKIHEMSIKRMEDNSYKIIVEGELKEDGCS